MRKGAQVKVATAVIVIRVIMVVDVNRKKIEGS